MASSLLNFSEIHTRFDERRWGHQKKKQQLSIPGSTYMFGGAKHRSSKLYGLNSYPRISKIHFVKNSTRRKFVNLDKR